MTDRLTSPNAQYEAILQDDGNLVIYARKGRPVWASGADQYPDPVPPPPLPSLAPSLAIKGTSFIDTNTGQPWPWRSVTAYKLFQLWLDGDMQRVKDWTAWMRRNKIPMARTSSMFDGGLGRLIPAEYPSYWTGMEEFFEAMAGEGIALEFTIFCDAQSERLKKVVQADHYARVREIVARHHHIVVEICNEPPKNGVDIKRIMVDDPRIVQATGLYDMDDTGLYEYLFLNFITDHTPRDAEWPRKARRLQETSAALWVPCVGDEPFGIGRILPPPASQSRSLVASDHAQYHALASLFGAGSTIHGTFGNELRLPDAEEQACVDAITASWAIIPPEVHESWRYTRGGLAGCPLKDNGLRTYAMVSPDGQRAWAVRVRPTAPPEADSGWRITAEHGYQGCVVECARR